MQSMSAILAGIYTISLMSTAFEQLVNDHGIKHIGDLSSNFSDHNKCNGKLDCLIYEMLFIKKNKLSLNKQSDSIRAKLFV